MCRIILQGLEQFFQSNTRHISTDVPVTRSDLSTIQPPEHAMTLMSVPITTGIVTQTVQTLSVRLRFDTYSSLINNESIVSTPVETGVILAKKLEAS